MNEKCGIISDKVYTWS